jgi:nuclear protein localization protein 4 homolog
MRLLNELGAPDVPTSRQRGGGSDAERRRLELAKWLSDWHLVAFLGTCGLLSEVSACSSTVAHI